ncbi:FAD-dependent oxidoreductase [bacterium]|nr:FAD-dependent oxidoreductase [candidate division CSSED10-310 bacterium]
MTMKAGSRGWLPRCLAALAAAGVILTAAATEWTAAGGKEGLVRSEVLVYGGTAGAVIAALSAAAEGADTVLIAPTAHLGGMTTSGLGRTDVGVARVIGGRAAECYSRIGAVYGKAAAWDFEPSVAEKVIETWVAESALHVYRECRIGGVAKQGGNITSIRAGGRRFLARVYIDGSYEGDLMAAAGISHSLGRESRKESGETLAGVRGSSLHHRFSVPVSALLDGGGLVPLVEPGPPGPPGTGDDGLPAYTYRLCISRQPDNRVPFTPPEGYRSSRYELLHRYLVKATVDLDDLLLIWPLPNDKADLNNRGPISTDYIGGSHDYPTASWRRRRQIEREHEEYIRGLLWFLVSDPGVPRAIREELGQWGLAADEFISNGNWPHQVYIREARRLNGMARLVEADVLLGRSCPDSIGMGSYQIDSHHVHRYATAEGLACNEGDIQVAARPYQIPYGIMLPRPEECRNLLVCTCVSATHVAFSSLRMEPQFMIMGHAAGVAAAMAAANGLAVQAVVLTELQDRLQAQGQVLSLGALAAPALPDPRTGR